MTRFAPFRILFLTVALCVPAPLALQAQDETDDPGFLERMIQNALGGDGRDVRIVGLEGVLSSEVSIARIEVADDDGTWLVIRDVTLDWSRLALLRRRLEINALTLGAVELHRPPLPGPAQPPQIAAEENPAPFALPELPLALNVTQLSLGTLDIGQPVLGQPITATLTGAARLAGGEGTVQLALDRTDDRAGSFHLDAGFENDTRRLFVLLDAAEDAGGLIASLSGMPGAPSVDLHVAGDAPISDFTATLALATDGVDRLNGTVSLREEPAQDGIGTDRLVTARLAGDVADLFLPDYRDFFGANLSLALTARQNQATGLDVEDLALVTQGLVLNGRVKLSSTYAPDLIELTGRLGSQNGLPVVLPLPGPALLVNQGTLTVSFDAAAGDDLRAALEAEGIQRADGLLLDRARLGFDGQILRAAETTLSAVSGDLSALIDGFSSTDPALWQAVGDSTSLTGALSWTDGGPLAITRVSLRSDETLTAGGDLSITGLQSGVIGIDTDLDLTASDLSRFAAISGQPLGGAITTGLAGHYDLTGGGFDLELSGDARDIRFGQENVETLLQGDTTLALAARRTPEGIDLDRLHIDGENLALDGRVSIAPDGFPRLAQITGRIARADGAPLRLPLPGPATDLGAADLTVSYDATAGEAFQALIRIADVTRADGIAIGRTTVGATGTLDRGTDTLPRQIAAHLNADITGATAADPALAAALEPGLTLLADLDYRAAAGTAALRNLALNAGAFVLSGSADMTDIGQQTMAAVAEIDLDTGAIERFAPLIGQPLAGRLTARAEAAYDMGSDQFQIDLEGTGSGLRTGIAQADSLLAGDVAVTLRAAQDAQGLSLPTFTVRSREVTVQASGDMHPAGEGIGFQARLNDLAVLVPGLPGAVALNGQTMNRNGIWALNADLSGPGGTQASVSGDALRPDGTIDLTATGALPLALANRLIAPRSVLGDLRFDLGIQGQPGLDAVSGTITVANGRVSDPASGLAIEDLAATIRLARSQATLDLRGRNATGGRITVSGPVGLAAPFPATLDLALHNVQLIDPRLYEIDVDSAIAIRGPLAGGASVAGRVDIRRAEIKIPSSFGGSAEIPDMIHIGETRQSYATRQRAGLITPEDAGGTTTGGGIAYPMDITISAPNEIFVRGRGLDVEMGGQIHIGGTTAAPQPQGELRLIQGNMQLLARRLEFEEATVSMQGDLQPWLRLVASSQSDAVNASIVIEGPVTAPQIGLSSQPQLPEDEILAQLFFNKPVTELSPLELAQLASAIRTLTGGGGGGIFGLIRDGLGIDNLNVQSDTAGNTAVTAGKYINDRMYTDVTAGSDGTTEIELKYTITNDLKAKAGFDNTGNTGIGITFERDY
ncbi:MAG: translocation/assembly module TamB domain-containing protein [Qingshengfaniella sp.]